ncbi:MAG: SRPBCC family protein, partial [Calditrichaeota bacterium]
HIAAPVAKVWEAIEDLSLIPRYHPVVREVEYVSGQTRRGPGVAYKCVVPEGRQKGWCVERVVEHIPRRKTTVAFSGDSWGMGRMFDEFLAETTVEAGPEDTTLVHLKAYYIPRGFKMRLVHGLFMRRMMCKRAKLTLDGLKRLVEGQG